MIFDSAIVGILITILLALLSLAYGYGLLHGRVKSNASDIERNERDFKDFCDQIREGFRQYQVDNKQDHNAIQIKLDTLITGNGKK